MKEMGKGIGSCGITKLPQNSVASTTHRSIAGLFTNFVENRISVNSRLFLGYQYQKLYHLTPIVDYRLQWLQ